MFCHMFYLKINNNSRTIKNKIMNFYNLRLFLTYLFLILSSSYAQEKKLIDFNLQEQGWIIQDKYKNSSITIILKPDLDYETNFDPFPIKKALRPTYKNDQKLRYKIETDLNEQIFISDAPFYKDPIKNEIWLPRKNPDYLFTPKYTSSNRNITELHLATKTDGNIKSYSLILDKTSNEANEYLDYLYSTWNEYLKAENRQRITIIIVLIGILITTVYLLLFLIKKLSLYMRIKKEKLIENKRKKHIRETVENITLQETIRKELANQEPDELVALKKEIAKAITDGDASKIEYLLKLAERLKKFN